MMKSKSYLESQIEKYRTHPVAVAQRAALLVSDRIVRQMEARGMTRGQLAKKAGLHPSQVTRALGGEHNLTLATLGKLAAALRVEVGDLFSAYAPSDAKSALEARSPKPPRSKGVGRVKAISKRTKIPALEGKV